MVCVVFCNVDEEEPYQRSNHRPPLPPGHGHERSTAHHSRGNSRDPRSGRGVGGGYESDESRHLRGPNTRRQRSTSQRRSHFRHQNSAHPNDHSHALSRHGAPPTHRRSNSRGHTHLHASSSSQTHPQGGAASQRSHSRSRPHSRSGGDYSHGSHYPPLPPGRRSGGGGRSDRPPHYPPSAAVLGAAAPPATALAAATGRRHAPGASPDTANNYNGHHESHRRSHYRRSVSQSRGQGSSSSSNRRVSITRVRRPAVVVCFAISFFFPNPTC